MLAPDIVLQSRYRIVRQLGQGGMGTVYEAIDQRFNSEVAIKESHFTDDSARKQFEREARLLNKLRHPAMTRVIDHFTEGDAQFLVMDYVEGEDLWAMLRKRGGAFPVAQVMGWADQLLDALAYLHRQDPPIIHRDVKPQNLKLSDAGQIILLDFGLAKGALGQTTTMTSRSVYGYTPIYAPVEQILAQGTDPRSDIYSLGATLYHLITGVAPMDAPTRFNALEEGRPDPLRPAHQLNPEVTAEISGVLMRAMAVSRRDRLQSAVEMLDALKEASQQRAEKDRLKETALPSTIGREPQEAKQQQEAQPAPQTVAEPILARQPQQPNSTVAAPTLAFPAAPPGGPASLPTEQLPPYGVFGQPAKKSNSLPWIIGGVVMLVVALIAVAFYVRFRNGVSGTDAQIQSEARRSLEPGRRGRIFDRTGSLENALAFNQQGARVYPMDTQFAHLLGPEFGAPGLDRALYPADAEAKDVRLTVSRELQQAIVEQLHGRSGTVVILNPQTGELLGMYSNPTYSLKEAQDKTKFLQLDADKINRPLVNRALNQYYIAGATFTTLTMIAAHRAGVEDSQFVCSGEGFTAMPGAKPIFDDGGPGEVHGPLGIDRAYEVSCNQYFAQMAVKLGPERVSETAKLVGIGAYDTPAESLRSRPEPELWNASSEGIKRALAPTESTVVMGKAGQNFTRFDLALEGYGQGYAGQMTPFQMALLASAIGNMEGKLMKPKVEYDRPPEVFNQVMTPQVAQRLRDIMGLVTEGPEGTARVVFAPVKAGGISTGGKTGTALKILPIYDPKTRAPMTRTVLERDAKGNVTGQREEIVLDTEHPRIDGWFLCIAPRERPQIAIAVVVEGGGYGSRTAAPIAAALVLKAKALGLLEAGH